MANERGSVTPILKGNGFIESGISVREHFAALALQSIVGRMDVDLSERDMEMAGELAVLAANAAMDKLDETQS